MNIIELEKSFVGSNEVKDMSFEQILSSDKGYLYEVKDGTQKRYEVFKRKISNICVDFEKRLYSETEMKIVYPKSKDFGLTAWTYSNYNKAFEKFENL